jgi:hypothetical protein
MKKQSWQLRASFVVLIAACVLQFTRVVTTQMQQSGGPGSSVSSGSSNMPAGTNLVGKVGVDQTTPARPTRSRLRTLGHSHRDGQWRGRGRRAARCHCVGQYRVLRHSQRRHGTWNIGTSQHTAVPRHRLRHHWVRARATAGCTQTTRFSGDTVDVATGAGTSVTATTTCVTRDSTSITTPTPTVTFRLADNVGHTSQLDRRQRGLLAPRQQSNVRHSAPGGRRTFTNGITCHRRYGDGHSTCTRARMCSETRTSRSRVFLLIVRARRSRRCKRRRRPSPVSLTTFPVLTKGTQGATGASVQDLKDAGRTTRDAHRGRGHAGGSRTRSSPWRSSWVIPPPGGVTTYAVTSGKTLRVEVINIAFTSSTTTANKVRVRLRTLSSGACIATSPLVGTWELALPNGTLAANAGQAQACHRVLARWPSSSQARRETSACPPSRPRPTAHSPSRSSDSSTEVSTMSLVTHARCRERQQRSATCRRVQGVPHQPRMPAGGSQCSPPR